MRKEWRLPLMSRARYHDVISQYIRWARLQSGLPFLPTLGVLKDKEGASLCMKHFEKKCDNMFCTESHNPIEIDLNIVHKRGDSYLMYEHLQLAFTDIYGTPFLWKNGIFISKYFEQYSELKPYTYRKDPMTWKNETRRVESNKDIRYFFFHLHHFFNS